MPDHVLPYLPGAGSQAGSLADRSIYPRLWIDDLLCTRCGLIMRVGTMCYERPETRVEESGATVRMLHIGSDNRTLAVSQHVCEGRRMYGPAADYDWNAAWTAPSAAGACGLNDCPCCTAWRDWEYAHECGDY